MNRAAELVRATAARGVVAAALVYLKWRAHRMAETLPAIPAGEIERVAAEGDPDDMVLLNPDGSLTLDPTPDDIATYQQPGGWPKYICRMSTVRSKLRRGGAAAAAAELSELMARQAALEAVRGPHATAPTPPPGNAPVRVSESGVSISNMWW